MYKHICLIFILSCCLVNTAQAHRTKVFAWVDGTSVAGEVYFGGGDRAKGANVELLVGEQLVASTNADEQGEFRFERPQPGDYQLKANAGQGHVATFVISADEFLDLSGSAAGTIETQGAEHEDEVGFKNRETCAVLNEAALVKVIQPLRNQLDQYEANIRWHDILGGIGYILGLFGLWSLMRTRRG
ncbi:carboxypeptidase regulatory-like domain-containing protein [Shewanella canadensis]|uniref:Carboxypeptidase regulatory-like domain-containing protein n=1 Tax=Shewanella canadensis TaxID=271096 RepID=A0A431WQ45_9GAMM|nr:carboxypeptidase-like regulatory domain-containing protein [Shewanella canadensis]RTR37583.1 carboxypeptidase regulatory-like domain-containing protein [Shewanella canadensis]